MKSLKIMILTISILLFATVSFAQNKECLKVLFDKPIFLISLDVQELFKLKFMQKMYKDYEKDINENSKKLDFDIKKDLKSVSYAYPVTNIKALTDTSNNEYSNIFDIILNGYFIFEMDYDIDKFVKHFSDEYTKFITKDSVTYFLSGDVAFIFVKDYFLFTKATNLDTFIINYNNKATNQSADTNTNSVINSTLSSLFYAYVDLAGLDDYIDNLKKEFSYETINEDIPLTKEEYKSVIDAIGNVKLFTFGLKYNSDGIGFHFSINFTDNASAKVIYNLYNKYMQKKEYKEYRDKYLMNAKLEIKGNDLIYDFKVDEENLKNVVYSYGLFYNPDIEVDDNLGAGDDGDEEALKEYNENRRNK